MSDGPHRSLGLTPCWKRASKLAGNPAFSDSEVAEAMEPAVLEFVHRELPDELRRNLWDIVDAPQRTLAFCPLEERVRALEPQFPGGKLGRLLINFVASEMSSGREGEAALIGAMIRALHHRVAANLRAVEEHWRASALYRDAARVVGRLETGFGMLAMTELARSAIRGTLVRVSAPQPRASGLDDGVSLA